MDFALRDLHGALSDPCLDQMNFLNEVTARYPDAVSFGPGRPYEGLYRIGDAARLIDAYVDHLRRDEGLDDAAIARMLYQYGPAAGIVRRPIARMLERTEGIVAAPEDVVVTAGAQEAMLIVLRALFSGPEDVLLVTDPCYVGIVGAARLLDIGIVGVAEGGDGPDRGALARTVARLKADGRRPRAFYLNADFANPSGQSMSVSAREDLLAFAAAQRLALIEDNAYGLFAAPGGRRPTLKALDRDRTVIYVGSFAKSAFPGIRTGFVVADQPVTDGGRLADQFGKIKSMVTINTAPLAQAVVGGLLIACDGDLAAANRRGAAWYERNRRALLAALEAAFPPGHPLRGPVSWNRPEGGFFLTLDVPFEADAEALARSAADYGVIWTPMRSFYLGPGGERQIRLSYSYLAPDRLREGVTRLAAFLSDRVPAAPRAAAGATPE